MLSSERLSNLPEFVLMENGRACLSPKPTLYFAPCWTIFLRRPLLDACNEGQMRKTQETPKVTRCLSGHALRDPSGGKAATIQASVCLLSQSQTSVLHFCHYSLTTGLREETACAGYLVCLPDHSQASSSLLCPEWLSCLLASCGLEWKKNEVRVLIFSAPSLRGYHRLSLSVCWKSQLFQKVLWLFLPLAS